MLDKMLMTFLQITAQQEQTNEVTSGRPIY